MQYDAHVMEWRLATAAQRRNRWDELRDMRRTSKFKRLAAFG